MADFISVSHGLIVCFLVCSSEGQEKITAELGQNVILPCKVPNNIAAVKWRRPEIKPEYVLFYRDGHFDPDSQHPSYQNRVDLQDKEMKDGDFSLILKNVKKNDSGIYECQAFQKGTNHRKRTSSMTKTTYNITLEVHESVQKIPADLGEDVILPCEVPNNINDITAVKWIRPDQDPEYVLVYRNGRIDQHNQHPSYQNRVDLQDKELKGGDVSLVLKNVMMNDTGRYECLVFEKGKKEPVSIINLEVYPSGKKDRLTGDGGDKDGGNKDGGNKDGGNKDGGSNVGVIVGSVVGVILLLAVLASVGFLIYRRSMVQNQHVKVPIDERPVS